MADRKFYVVWEGREPGIYDNWDDCQEQVEGYPGAKYKSYTSQTAATEAYRGDPARQLTFARELGKHIGAAAKVDYTAIPGIRLDAVAVDGACSRNPGPTEYRGVRVADGVEIFRMGPFDGGTNNLGEYIAIIHMAALLDKRGDHSTPIYSDSRTALSWVRAGHSRSTVISGPGNARIMELLRRADSWLAAHGGRIANPLLKWDTDNWGEIPADFGRK